MANLQRGDVTLRIGDRDRTFRLSWNAIGDAQDLLDEPSLPSMMQRLNTADFRVLRAVLAAGLRAGGWRDADPRAVFDMIPRDGLMAVLNGVRKAMEAALADDAGAAEPKPEEVPAPDPLPPAEATPNGAS